MSEVSTKVQNPAVEQNEEDFGKLLEKFEKNPEGITQGVIIRIENDEVFVDIGRKSEGILDINEIKNENGDLLFKEKDFIKVAQIGSHNGKPKLSYKKALRKEKCAEFISNYNEKNDEIFEVKVINRNKGGLVTVDKNGVEFFLPKSQYNSKDNENLVGKSFKVKILKVNKEEQSIVVSRKKARYDERKNKNEAIERLMEKDELIEGVVKKITSYGMFVDVGNVDGLVHYSEISYKGPVNPGTIYKEGDKVLVKVIKYDQERKHLSLSIKAALPDPWVKLGDELEVGDVISVVVSNIEKYGAFVDIGNDMEGFLHISEISWDKNIKNPQDYISKGQEIDVEVIEINVQERRLRVSLRKLQAKPFDEFLKNHKVGDVVQGVVSSVAAFGAFVRIGTVEGLLHNEDASWDRAQKCKDLFKNGDEIKVKITKIDEANQKLSLSIKDLILSPVQEYAKNHKVGEIVKGVVKDIKEFGVFVELQKGVEALIHKEDISIQNLENIKIKDDIDAVIAFIDEKKNRIRLSVKNLAKIKQRELLNEINSDDKVSLGDLIKERLS